MQNLLEAWFKMNVGDGAFYMVFGFIFVFLGIALLVLIFTGLGLVMKKVNERKQKQKAAPVPAQEIAAPTEEGISPEVVAAISAALMSYYEEEKGKCDFVVRRIKRI